MRSLYTALIFSAIWLTIATAKHAVANDEVGASVFKLVRMPVVVPHPSMPGVERPNAQIIAPLLQPAQLFPDTINFSSNLLEFNNRPGMGLGIPPAAIGAGLGGGVDWNPRQSQSASRAPGPSRRRPLGW